MMPPRLRRSLLMLPGNRLDRMRKAHSYGADCLVLDLEDSFPSTQKQAARQAVAQALRESHGGQPEVCVRISALAGGLAEEDLLALPLEMVNSLMIPKVESARELEQIDSILDRLEAVRAGRTPTDLIITIETPLSPQPKAVRRVAGCRSRPSRECAR